MRRMRIAAVTAAGLTLSVGAVVTPVSADTGGHRGASTAKAPAAAGTSSATVRLITGDRVTVHTGADDRRTASVVPGEGPRRPSRLRSSAPAGGSPAGAGEVRPGRRCPPSSLSSGQRPIGQLRVTCGAMSSVKEGVEGVRLAAVVPVPQKEASRVAPSVELTVPLLEVFARDVMLRVPSLVVKA